MKTINHILAAALTLACALPAGGEFLSSGGFPAGTMMSAAAGDIAVEDIKPGDRILAFSDENLVQSEVRDIYSKRSLLFTITTTQGKLVTTREQLLLTWSGFTAAQRLKPGDGVAIMKNGRRTWAKIKSTKTGKPAMVYDFETGPPHTFIANGFLGHN